MSNPKNRNAAILSTTLIGSLLLASECRPEAGTLRNDGRDEEIDEQTGDMMDSVFSANRNRAKLDKGIDNQSDEEEEKHSAFDKPPSKLGSNAVLMDDVPQPDNIDSNVDQDAAKPHSKSVQMEDATDAGRLADNSLSQIVQQAKEKLFGKDKGQNWWSNVPGVEHSTAGGEEKIPNTPDYYADEGIVASSKTLNANNNDHVQRQSRRIKSGSSADPSPSASSDSSDDSSSSSSKDSTSSARSKITLFDRVPPQEISSKSAKSVARNQVPVQTVLPTPRLPKLESKSKSKSNSSKSQPTNSGDTDAGSSSSKSGGAKNTKSPTSQGLAFGNKSGKDAIGGFKSSKSGATSGSRPSSSVSKSTKLGKSSKSDKSSKLNGQTSSPTAGDGSAQPTIPATTLPTTSASPTTVPSELPSTTPSVSAKPSDSPSQSPTDRPSSAPSAFPTRSPSEAPSSKPSSLPSSSPIGQPSAVPSSEPSALPSARPIGDPSAAPSFEPSASPSPGPSSGPSGAPSSAPSTEPTPSPSFEPTASAAPTTNSQAPTKESQMPSGRPTDVFSSGPSNGPTEAGSSAPSGMPSDAPSSEPSLVPSGSPSSLPSIFPSSSPSIVADCKTGTGREVSTWCANNNLNCCCEGTATCAGAYEEEACFWESNTIEMCDNSCNGDEACYFFPEVADIRIGDGSCTGEFACTYLTANVGDDACNGGYACYYNSTPEPGILDNECNGERACAVDRYCVRGNSDTVTTLCADNDLDCCCSDPASCPGLPADAVPCDWDSTNVEVCKSACNGDDACDFEDYVDNIRIGKGSCVGLRACRYLDANVGDYACIGEESCYYNTDPLGIDPGSCVDYKACLVRDAECTTGTGAEATTWCADPAYNRTCCCEGGADCPLQATYPFPLSCDWVDDEIEVCENACNGNVSCYFSPDTTDIKIGNSSCNGYYACSYNRATIGNRACNGNRACFDFNEGEVIAGSCNEGTNCEFVPL